MREGGKRRELLKEQAKVMVMAYQPLFLSHMVSDIVRVKGGWGEKSEERTVTFPRAFLPPPPFPFFLLARIRSGKSGHS